MRRIKFTSKEATRGFHLVLACIANGRPVIITRHGNPVAVVKPIPSPEEKKGGAL